MTQAVETLKAPFPYFGGKSKVAAEVWRRFGDVANYVEPFAGSLAVLLARPTPPRLETVNDLDGFITNFWRATARAPLEVARHADWPVNELDLHARHRWLVEQEPDLAERLRADPDYCDPRVAGWWVWGISQWIGAGWCKRPEWEGRGAAGRAPRGIHAARLEQTRPHLWKHGMGVNALSRQLPSLGPYGERGVHNPALPSLAEEFRRLAARLRRVRVACGDWARVVTPSVTWKQGLTGVFLDPPYGHAERDRGIYRHDSDAVARRVREWCLANGDNPLLRIALCGYVGEGHDALAEHGWEVYRWKANGGYGNQGEGKGRRNRALEAIWFSPHCLKPLEQPLWGEVGA